MIVQDIQFNEKKQIEKVVLELNGDDVYFFHMFNVAIKAFIEKPQEEPKGE